MLGTGTMSWKSLVRWAIPKPLLGLRSRRVVRAYASEVEQLSLAERFGQIYATGAWGTAAGASFFSGPGSLPNASFREEEIVCAFLNKHDKASTIVDVGCGDFQVGRRILSKVQRPVTYIGCDVVPELIAHNQSMFGSGTTRFEVCDITVDGIPLCDLVLCRQVFQHLSNANILSAIEMIRQSSPYALFTNAMPNNSFVPNLDLPAGVHTRIALGSGLRLDEAPFMLRPIEAHENRISDYETLQTMLVRF